MAKIIMGKITREKKVESIKEETSTITSLLLK